MKRHRGTLRRGELAIALVMTICGVAAADFPLNPFRQSPSAQDPFAARGGMTSAAAQPSVASPPPVRLAQYQAPRQNVEAGTPVQSGDPLNYRPPAQQLRPLAQPIARIGDETIFDVEVAGAVNQQLAQRARPDMSGRQIEQLRRELTRQALATIIDQKIVVYKARKEIPADAWPKIEKSVNEQFDKTHLKELMSRVKATTRHELDRAMQAQGTSIERQKKAFLERSLAAQWIRKEVNYDPEVTHQEMLDYYRAHREEYLVKGRVNWEELSVRFDRFPSKEAAFQAIAEMGNEVLSGRPLAEVAKAKSHGITAADGGARGWTNQASLASELIDQALFTLPVGTLSRILEDDRGFSIVRVVAREEATYKSFVDVQTDIRESIKKEKVDRGVKEYLAKLRAQTPIWTIFDAPGEETLSSGAESGG